MTESEAIAKFERTSVLWESASNTEMVEAVKVAIQVLSEIQQYRAIGTVSEFRELKEMTIVSEVETEYDGWIPCSERLPEEPEENPYFDDKRLEIYLVTKKNEKYPFRAFWNGNSFTDGWSKVDVLAWMPLPEPWKGELDAKEK